MISEIEKVLQKKIYEKMNEIKIFVVMQKSCIENLNVNYPVVELKCSSYGIQKKLEYKNKRKIIKVKIIRVQLIWV